MNDHAPRLRPHLQSDEITVKGLRFAQEDSPEEIAGFIQEL
jgi:hypothetical protein